MNQPGRRAVDIAKAVATPNAVKKDVLNRLKNSHQLLTWKTHPAPETAVELSLLDSAKDPDFDQQARQKVFESIVRHTLDNPEHPYYSLVNSRLRKEMIDDIAQVLTASHYIGMREM